MIADAQSVISVASFAERVFPCGRWPGIQARQSPNQEHSGDEINQFLSALIHYEDKIASSLYVRLSLNTGRPAKRNYCCQAVKSATSRSIIPSALVPQSNFFKLRSRATGEN